MNQSLSPLEHDVISMLLAGNDPAFAELREQLRGSTAMRRELTGAGFYTHLAVPASARPADIGPGTKLVSGVFAEIEGLDHGAGFILTVENGVLDYLEGFSYDEPWPQMIGRYTLSYPEGEPPALQ